MTSISYAFIEYLHIFIGDDKSLAEGPLQAQRSKLGETIFLLLYFIDKSMQNTFLKHNMAYLVRLLVLINVIFNGDCFIWYKRYEY